MSLISPQKRKKPYVWFDINASTFFNVYKVEGVFPEDPEEDLIVFEVNSSYLRSSLGGLKTASFVEIKLQKDGFPFFTINLKLKIPSGQEKDASHHVPVIIVPRVQWPDFFPPYDSIQFDFEAKCPRPNIFRRFIDTFKYSNTIRIILRKIDKTLTIEGKGETTRHFTVFSNIQIDELEDSTYDEEIVSALVEQKTVAQWLHANITFKCHIQIHCLIQNNNSFKLCFHLGDEIIANFVQAAEYDDDDEDSEKEFEGSKSQDERTI